MKTSINPHTLEQIRKALEPHLQEIGRDLGIDIKAGRGVYAETSGTLKLELSSISDGGEVVTKEATAFKRDAMIYGFVAGDLGRTFESHGKTFKITGLNTRATKMPINAVEVSTSRAYKFRAEAIAKKLHPEGIRSKGSLTEVPMPPR